MSKKNKNKGRGNRASDESHARQPQHTAQGHHRPNHHAQTPPKGRGYTPNAYQQHLNAQNESKLNPDAASWVPSKVDAIERDEAPAASGGSGRGEEGHVKGGGSSGFWEVGSDTEQATGVSQQRRDEGDQRSSQVPEDIKCPVCFEIYNDEFKPKILTCGHSLCSKCLSKKKTRNLVGCPLCREPTNLANGDVPTNFTVLNLAEHFARNKPKFNANKSSSSSSKKKARASPHESKCRDSEAEISAFCHTCRAWLCAECHAVDHHGCKVVPARQALTNLTTQRMSLRQATLDSLTDLKSQAELYGRSMDSFRMVMRAAFEVVEAEEKASKMLTKDIEENINKIEGISTIIQDQELRESLTNVEKVKEICEEAEKWKRIQITRISSSGEFLAASQVLLRQAVQLSQGVAHPRFVAQQQQQGGRGARYARMSLDGLRTLVHALEPMDDVTGMRAIPLQNVIPLLDNSSALTFLELSWGGRVQGRVYVRMLGDTARGRQFVSVCLGDQGPTLKTSHFHRVWWKGQPGEHIWGGDHDAGDGSGGGGVAVQAGLRAGYSSPVQPGLVAGRYEQDNVSTIFRVYTKGAEEGVDDAAFGMVEFGLHHLEAAIKHNNITDIIISDCGVVVENRKDG